MSLPGLTELLSPVSEPRWRAEHFGRRPLVARGPLPRFGALADLDPQRLIDSAPAAHLDAIRGGIGQPYAADATSSIRIKRTQLLDDRIRDFMLGLYQTLDEELNVNAYLSPSAEASGLAPHEDGYDVFVLQLAGAKHWHIHDLDDEFELRAGDMLYLPAGLRHSARNRDAAPSFHLTVGVLSKTEHSIVEWLATELSHNAKPTLDDISFDRVAEHARAILDDPARRERFTAHRRAIEYERMLATPEEHARLDARRLR